MSLRGYKDYFQAKEQKNWVSETANLWFRPDGSPKTRATTQTMIFDTMKRYGIEVTEAAQILEKSILFYSNEHVVGGSEAYWELVKKMANKINEAGLTQDQLDKGVPTAYSMKPGTSVMYAHLNPKLQKYAGFATSAEQARIYSQDKFPVEKVSVSANPQGNYWGLWRNGRYEIANPSKAEFMYQISMVAGEEEGDELGIEEYGKKTPVSVTPIKNMTEAGAAPDAPPVGSPRSRMSRAVSSVGSSVGNEMVNFNRVFARLEETRPSDLRRLLRKSLSSGDFDDDPDFKKEVEDLHQKLSTGRMRNASKKYGSVLGGGQQDYVSRPSADGPDSEGTGGNA